MSTLKAIALLCIFTTMQGGKTVLHTAGLLTQSTQSPPHIRIARFKPIAQSNGTFQEKQKFFETLSSSAEAELAWHTFRKTCSKLKHPQNSPLHTAGFQPLDRTLAHRIKKIVSQLQLFPEHGLEHIIDNPITQACKDALFIATHTDLADLSTEHCLYHFNDTPTECRSKFYMQAIDCTMPHAVLQQECSSEQPQWLANLLIALRLSTTTNSSQHSIDILQSFYTALRPEEKPQGKHPDSILFEYLKEQREELKNTQETCSSQTFYDALSTPVICQKTGRLHHSDAQLGHLVALLRRFQCSTVTAAYQKKEPLCIEFIKKYLALY